MWVKIQWREGETNLYSSPSHSMEGESLATESESWSLWASDDADDLTLSESRRDNRGLFHHRLFYSVPFSCSPQPKIHTRRFGEEPTEARSVACFRDTCNKPGHVAAEIHKARICTCPEVTARPAARHHQHGSWIMPRRRREEATRLETTTTDRGTINTASHHDFQ